MKCWNCLRPIAKKDHVCHACGQATKPNPMQSTTAKSRLEYLLHETSQWSFLPPEVRQELGGVYRQRLERLQALDSGISSEAWPDSDWTAPFWSEPLSLGSLPIPGAVPRMVTEKLDRSALAAFQAAPTPETMDSTAAVAEAAGETTVCSVRDTVALSGFVPAATAAAPLESPPERPSVPAEEQAATRLSSATDWVQSARAPTTLAQTDLTQRPAQAPSIPVEEPLAAKILAEADIRWFHSLGALLVVAAVIGWLRATWDGYGKNLAGLLILLCPAALHAVAYQMRLSVPISARLLAILAGLLTAPALLAVEIFDFLPPAVSGRDYWTFALLVSGGLLAWQAQAMKERVPLFVGALCMAMAGWSQGALVTSAICLMIGFLLGPTKVDETEPAEEREWKLQLQKVGFAAGVFGCFSTLFLFRPVHGTLTPLLAFAGALVYLHLPTLTRQSDQSSDNRVALQATITVLGIVLMRALLDVPASGVGLYTLLAAGLFLSARPEHEGGLLALRVGSFFGLIGLAIGFFSNAPMPWGAPGSNPAETVMRFLLALVGAVLFGSLSRQVHLESQATLLGFGALFSTFGGWYHLFVMVCEPVNGSYFAKNGQLAPLFASFGLWVVLWLVGARWLRSGERDLVRAVTLPILLASILACLSSGLALGLRAQVWAAATLWLGAVSLAWDRGLLITKDLSDAESAQPSSDLVNGVSGQTSGLGPTQAELLPRMALWALTLGAAFAAIVPASQVPLPMQVLGLVLMLSPARSYRQPALEMVWLVAPASFFYHWSSQPWPGQLWVMYLLCLAGWAAGPARASSLVLTTGVGLGVVIGSLSSAHHLALLSLPLVYGLCLALATPGQGPYSKPHPAQYGFDLLLNACLFLPLSLKGGSPQSFAVTVGVPVLAFAFGWAAKNSFAGRVVSATSAHWLLLAGFVWSLAQGPQESGLLMLLASVWAFTLKEKSPVKGLEAWDLGNGLALLGVAWLLGESHVQPNLMVLGLGVLLSECLALASERWRPDHSNTIFLIALLVLTSGSDVADPEMGLTLMAGLLAGIRGLATTHLPLVAAGLVTFLKVTDGQMALADASFKMRLLPLAAFLIGASFWLLMRADHPTRRALGFHPMASLRAGIALLAIPPLLTLAIDPSIADFAWVLAVGCSCLALSQGFGQHPELRQLLKQSGGYVLTGWAAVSLGRAAMALPWQLATLVVGLVMVGVGVKVEKNRKG